MGMKQAKMFLAPVVTIINLIFLVSMRISSHLAGLLQSSFLHLSFVKFGAKNFICEFINARITQILGILSSFFCSSNSPSEISLFISAWRGSLKAHFHGESINWLFWRWSRGSNWKGSDWAEELRMNERQLNALLGWLFEILQGISSHWKSLEAPKDPRSSENP